MVASIWDVRGTRIAIVARLIAAVLRLIHASPKAAILRQAPGKSRGIPALMRLALILAAIEKSLHLLGRLRQNRPRLGHHQQQRTMLRIARLLRQTHALDRMTAEQLGATHTPPLPTIKLSLPIVAKYASAAGNGKVSEACAIMDSLGAVEQLLGHALDFTALPLDQREPSATDKAEA